MKKNRVVILLIALLSVTCFSCKKSENQSDRILNPKLNRIIHKHIRILGNLDYNGQQRVQDSLIFISISFQRSVEKDIVPIKITSASFPSPFLSIFPEKFIGFVRNKNEIITVVTNDPKDSSYFSVINMNCLNPSLEEYNERYMPLLDTLWPHITYNTDGYSFHTQCSLFRGHLIRLEEQGWVSAFSLQNDSLRTINKMGISQKERSLIEQLANKGGVTIPDKWGEDLAFQITEIGATKNYYFKEWEINEPLILTAEDFYYDKDGYRIFASLYTDTLRVPVLLLLEKSVSTPIIDICL